MDQSEFMSWINLNSCRVEFMYRKIVPISRSSRGKAWFPLVLRIATIGDSYDFPTSGILMTSRNTASQTSQTVGDFYDVIGRIGSISTLKVHPRQSPTSAILPISVKVAVLRIVIVVRIPESRNRKNPPPPPPPPDSYDS